MSSTTTDLKLATFTRLSVSCPGSMTRWCSSPSLCSSASSSRTRLVFKCQMLARCVLANNQKSIAAHLFSVTQLMFSSCRFQFSQVSGATDLSSLPPVLLILQSALVNQTHHNSVRDIMERLFHSFLFFYVLPSHHAVLI